MSTRKFGGNKASNFSMSRKGLQVRCAVRVVGVKAERKVKAWDLILYIHRYEFAFYAVSKQ